MKRHAQAERVITRAAKVARSEAGADRVELGDKQAPCLISNASNRHSSVDSSESKGLPDRQSSSSATSGTQRSSTKRLNQGKPKRPMSAYTIFLQETLQNRPHGTPAIISRDIAVRWHGMSQAEKKKYVEKAQEDRRRYDEEIETLRPRDIKQDSVKTSTQSVQGVVTWLPYGGHDEAQEEAEAQQEEEEEEDKENTERDIDGEFEKERKESIQTQPDSLPIHLPVPLPTRMEPFNPFAITPETTEPKTFIIRVRLEGDPLFREIALYDFTFSELLTKTMKKLQLRGIDPRQFSIVKPPDTKIGDDEDVQNLRANCRLEVRLHG